MFFKIHFDKEVYAPLYEDYCRFLYEEIQKSVKNSINKRKYDVRVPYVINSSIMKWNNKPPSSLNLVYYVTHCLELVREKNEYVIRVNPKMKVLGSKTKVSTLIRLLEFGNEKIPPLPVICSVLKYYQERYPYLLTEFIERRMTE